MVSCRTRQTLIFTFFLGVTLLFYIFSVNREHIALSKYFSGGLTVDDVHETPF